jgi:hypothetical protein
MRKDYKAILKKLIWDIIVKNTVEKNLKTTYSFGIGMRWMNKIEHLPNNEVKDYIKNVKSLANKMFKTSKKLLAELEKIKKFEPTDEDDQKISDPYWLSAIQEMKKKMTKEEMEEYIDPFIVLRRIILDLSMLKDTLEGKEYEEERKRI